MERIRSHAWPGNVRELEMCMRVALVLCDGTRLLPEHVRLYPLTTAPTGEDELVRDLPERQRRLLEEWPAGEPIRCAEYRRRYGLSRRTATRDLAGLVDCGLLLRHGKGPGTRYVRAVTS
jgi:DNA-binding NtrC family response regulator